MAYENKLASQERRVLELEQKLESARKYHTPTMRHFEAIEYNVKDLEMRHSKVCVCVCVRARVCACVFASLRRT